ncbi:MAG: hypothetical protein HKN33_12250 [Pyrinomonadaceae bacterium]|nr:hypothetical protein [Pyrinomonadaceae bacterium]
MAELKTELKIVGYPTGFEKKQIKEMLVDRLGLEGIAAQGMHDAVDEGRIVTLGFDDEATAVGLGQELVEAGAKVEIKTA